MSDVLYIRLISLELVDSRLRRAYKSEGVSATLSPDYVPISRRHVLVPWIEASGSCTLNPDFLLGAVSAMPRRITAADLGMYNASGEGGT